MYKKKIDVLQPKEIAYADLSEHNEVIVETAGFVPLEVKMKRFEQNGMIAQFTQSEFTSSDLRTIYLNPDFEINPEDDFEDVQEKLSAQAKFIQDLKNKKTSEFLEQNSEVAPQDPKQKTTKDGNEESEVVE